MPVKSNFEVSVNGETAIPVNGRKEMDLLAKAAMQTGDSVTIYKDGHVDSELTKRYSKRANDTFKSQVIVQLMRRSYQLSSLVNSWKDGMTEQELATELGDISSSLTNLYDIVAERLSETTDFNPFEEEIPQTV